MLRESATAYSAHFDLRNSAFQSMGQSRLIEKPLSMVKVKDGKASITLAKAEFSNAEKVTTKTEVVSSNLEAGNINLTAKSEEDGKGNITIKGSNLVAKEDKVNGEAREGALGQINLNADNDVTITEAKNTEKTASKDMKGKAELKLTVKNEYVQIGYAVKAAKEAKDNLQKAKSSYSQYKRDLGVQRGKLLKLKADLANGKVGIEQADIDEFEGLIDDLKQDDAFYKANIALAVADLATKTIAVASQMATAASSSGTYGFSASLDLDIDLLEKQFEAYKEQSVASNLSGETVNITAGESATIRGSNVVARDINVESENLNVLASQDINTSSDSSEHKNINLSIGIYGAAGDSVGVSMDRSDGSSAGITNTNSQLNANNININTDDHTAIAGANVSASNKLNISTTHLDVASVQDSSKSRSSSQGFSISGNFDGDISGVGVNAGNSRTSQKETVLTTVTGGSVDINVEEGTTLRGATIAAVDSEGNDTGNLKLKTNTLEVSSLNNTRNSKSMSLGLNAGISSQQQRDRSNNDSTLNSVGIDFANNKSNSKTKTLGTIGEGNIEVANVDKSNTRMLNRDINDNEIDIYDIKSHKGLKGTIDTRVFTKKGRAEIADDIKKAKVGFYDVAKDIMTEKELTFLDAFSYQGNKIAFYDGMQKAFRENQDGIRDKLSDPNATQQEKNTAMQQIADGINAQLGIKNGNQVAVISTDARTKDGKEIVGAYHKPSGDIVLNDKNINNTGEAVKGLGHELGHTVGYGESVSDVMGASLEDYANFGMWNYGSDGQTLASTNNHNGTVDSQGNTIATTGIATQNFVERRNNGELEYRQVISIRGGGPAQATGISVNKNDLAFKGQDLSEYKKVYVNYINNKLNEKVKELAAKGYKEKDIINIIGQYKDKLVHDISAEEFDSSLVTLPNAIKALDPETKVKIFDGGQKDLVLQSILADYEKGEQIIIQGHSVGGGDTQDVAEMLKDKGISNVVTVQIDSIEPFGDDASIPSNVTKAVNVYQDGSKTGNLAIDFLDPDAMNGENEIHRYSPENTTVIVNKKFENVTGPSQGIVNSPHRNMDNDHSVQEFIQEQVLPEIKKDMEQQNNANN